MYTDGSDFHRRLSLTETPCFTSHFGCALANKIGAKQNLSTAFHPQTNGLSEQKNQWIEQYLCLIANAQQEDWSQWLTVVTTVVMIMALDSHGLSFSPYLIYPPFT